MKSNNSFFVFVFLLLLVFPPIFSLLFSTIVLFKEHGSKGFLIFAISYVICGTGWMLSYDNSLRFWDAWYYSPGNLIQDHFLNIILSFFIRNQYLQANHFFIIIGLLIIFLLYKGYRQYNKGNKFLLGYISFFVFFLNDFNNVFNLSYFTLSALIFIAHLRNIERNILLSGVLIILCYFIHPGVLMVYIPALLIYLPLKYKHEKIAILLLLVFGLLFLGFFITQYFKFDIASFGSINDKIDYYTSDENKWGQGEGEIGYRRVILETVNFLLLVYLFAKSYKAKKFREFPLLYSVFFVAFVFLVISKPFLFTISERLSIISIISGSILYYLLYNYDKLKLIRMTKFAIVYFFIALFCKHPFDREFIISDSYKEESVQQTMKLFYQPTIYYITFIDGPNDNFLYKASKFGSW